MSQQGYDEEFKQKIVGLYQSGVRQCDLMREFGISKKAIIAWRKKYPDPIELDNRGQLSEAQKELLILTEQVRKLKKENEILKSAAEWVEKKKR
jgi:transposase